MRYKGDVAIKRGPDWFRKGAATDEAYEGLKNEYHLMELLGPSGFVPKALELGLDDHNRSSIVENLGESQPVTDPLAFQWNVALLLKALRDAGIRHGDLTTRNIIVRDNKPMAIDFEESRRAPFGDGQDKRPEPDAYHLWKAVLSLAPDPSRYVRRWIAIRDSMGGAEDWDWALNKSVLDIGCYQGFMAQFAAVEGARARGVDIDGCISTYPSPAFSFSLGDGYDISYFYDVILLLSTYPYIFQQRGQEHAELVMHCIYQAGATLFFESQSHGDGPGSDTPFESQEHVGLWLTDFGWAVSPIVTLPIEGRDAERTVWKCERT